MENFESSRLMNYNNTEPMLYELLIWYFVPTAAMVPLGLPINALVVRLLLAKPGICSTSEIFTLTLAAFDLLFCLMFLAEYIRFVCFPTMESGNMAAWTLSLVGGPILQCFLSLDSYMAVCKPLVFIRLKDPKLRLSLCMVVTVVNGVCCYLVKVSSSIKWSLVSLIMANSIVTITTCGVQILRSLHSSGPGKKEVHPVKKRAFKIVLTSLLLVDVLYFPVVVEQYLRVYVPEHFAPLSFLTCVTCTGLAASSLVQPLCYLIRTKQLPSARC